MSALLNVDNLRVRFGSHEAVRGLSFALNANETLAVVGESGSGKTATALSIMRLLPRTATVDGHIKLLGQDILDLTPAAMRRLRGKDVSMVFQEPMSSLNPVMTVGDQIAETVRVHGASHEDARRRMLETLDLVRLPDPKTMASRYPHELSGGMRQRVMIAIAIANRPKLLIADEPTTALDVTIQGQILALLDALRRDLAMGLLFITHDLGLVARWADRVLVMRDGRKVEEAPAETLLTQPTADYTKHLLSVSPDFSSGRHYAAAAAAKTGDTRAPLLSVRGLAAGYGPAAQKKNAISDVSFDIQRGEILGLVGESGSGKSTLGKTVLRLIAPTAGEIVFDGADIARLPGEGALRPFRRRMQMVFQDPSTSLNPRQPIADILQTPLAVHGVTSRTDRERRVGEVLDRVGLARRSAALYPHEFSGGQRQRIGIARALLLKPDLVVCDEPVSALDVSIQAQILDLLIDLKRDLNLSYLFISHDLAVVRYMADRVIVMQSGRIVEHGDAATIWDAPQHPYTRTLLSAVTAARGDQSRSAQ